MTRNLNWNQTNGLVPPYPYIHVPTSLPGLLDVKLLWTLETAWAFSAAEEMPVLLLEHQCRGINTILHIKASTASETKLRWSCTTCWHARRCCGKACANGGCTLHHTTSAHPLLSEVQQKVTPLDCLSKTIPGLTYITYSTHSECRLTFFRFASKPLDLALPGAFPVPPLWSARSEVHECTAQEWIHDLTDETSGTGLTKPRTQEVPQGMCPVYIQ